MQGQKEQVFAFTDALQNFKKEECRLNEQISKMEEKLHILTTDQATKRWLYLSREDITNLPQFKGSTIFVVHAPHCSYIEVPEPEQGWECRLIIGSSISPIDIYLLSDYEDRGYICCDDSEEMTISGESGDLSNIESTPSSDPEKADSPIISAQTKSSRESNITKDDMMTTGLIKVELPECNENEAYWFSPETNISLTDLWK